MNNILPGSLQKQHLVAFDLLAKQRLDDIRLDKLFIYLVDTVSEDKLYWLAWEYNVLGYKGWKLADSLEKKRDLIKKAIELQRYKGTIWAVEEALRSVGFPDATVTEHFGHWARFKVNLNAGANVVTAETLDEVAAMIREYKNTRSHFAGIEIEITLADVVNVSDDSFEDTADELTDALTIGGDFRYNGLHNYDGSMNYSNDNDLLELTITNLP